VATAVQCGGRRRTRITCNAPHRKWRTTITKRRPRNSKLNIPRYCCAGVTCIRNSETHERGECGSPPYTTCKLQYVPVARCRDAMTVRFIYLFFFLLSEGTIYFFGQLFSEIRRLVFYRRGSALTVIIYTVMTRMTLSCTIMIVDVQRNSREFI